MDMQYNSEVASVKCRKLLRKNYKAQLNDVHPSENCNDLTPYGQSKIKDLFKQKRKHTSEDSNDGVLGESSSASKRIRENTDMELSTENLPEISNITLSEDYILPATENQKDEITNKNLHDKSV